MDLEFYKPTEATKLHLFLDVDGVVNLSKNSYPGLEFATVNLKPGAYSTGYEYNLYWQGKITKQLSLLSNDEVELVWLTTWREDAVRLLDPLWNINSKGFLQWEQKLSDYSQRFKGIALKDWSEAHPNTPFIWIDDVAIPARKEERFDFQKREDVFTISPDSTYGLQLSDIQNIKDFYAKLK